MEPDSGAAFGGALATVGVREDELPSRLKKHAIGILDKYSTMAILVMSFLVIPGICSGINLLYRG